MPAAALQMIPLLQVMKTNTRKYKEVMNQKYQFLRKVNGRAKRKCLELFRLCYCRGSYRVGGPKLPHNPLSSSFFFWLCSCHTEVPRPGIENLCHSSNLSCCSASARSLALCATRELLTAFFPASFTLQRPARPPPEVKSLSLSFLASMKFFNPY